MKLREIPPSRRQFWKETQAEQFAQKVIDQNQDYGKRDLPGNEVVVLALNEIAAEKGRMYFYFLPSRRAYDKTKQEGRLPAQRQAPTPSAEYPTIVGMDFVWDDEARSAFFADTHRGRYLRSDFIMNGPPSETPLYCIQYLGAMNDQLFATPHESLAIFSTSSSNYVFTMSELKRQLEKAPQNRLSAPQYLWKPELLDNGKSKMYDYKKRQRDGLEPSAVDNLEGVYAELLGYCAGPQRRLWQSSTAEEVTQLLPRPAQAATVGTALGEGQSAEPRSRRGETRKRPAKPERGDTDATDDQDKREVMGGEEVA